MKKILIYSLLFILLCPLYINAETEEDTIKAGEKSNISYAEAQKTIKEVMKQYYLRGPNIQYNYAKTTYPSAGIKISPEDATSQDNKYLVCAGFTSSVYAEAFGVYDVSDNPVPKYPKFNFDVIEEAYDFYNEKGAYERTNETSRNLDGNFLLYYESTTNEAGTYDSTSSNTRARDIVKYVYMSKEQNDSMSGEQYKFMSEEEKEYLTLVANVKPGDLFVYTGHVLIAYDVVNRGTDKNPVYDVLILNSLQNSWIRTRIPGTSQISYDTFHNYIKVNDVFKVMHNNVLDIDEEGSLKWTWLSDISEFVTKIDDKNTLKCNVKGGGECAVIRPFYKAKLNEDEDEDEAKAIFNYAINSSQYEKGKLRTEYPGLFIEKTVDVNDNNSVNVGDELTYTIKITNKDKNDWKGFNIEEEISQYVNLKSINLDGTVIPKCVGETCVPARIVWEIDKLVGGASVVLTYTVIVEAGENYGNVNNIISANGKFYSNDNRDVSISTGVVENKIIPKASQLLNKGETFESCYNAKKAEFNGLALIDKIYDCVTGKNFNFKNFQFENLFNVSLKDANSSPKSESIILYKDNLNVDNVDYDKIRNMILNNYFNGLYNNGYYLPPFNSNSLKRAKTINPTDFKDGDVLIYKITDGAHINSENELVHEFIPGISPEEGIYAYIYINGKFIGVNYPDDNDKSRDEFTFNYYNDDYNNSTLMCNNVYSGYQKASNSNLFDTNKTASLLEFVNYQTLFGKDYYMILRPEIAMKEVVSVELVEPSKKDYIQNYEELDLTGGFLEIVYNDGSEYKLSLDSENVKVTGFDNSKIGKNTLTVEYDGYTTTFDVEILSKQSTKIEIKTMPVKLEYIQNYNELDLTGGIIKVTYNDKSIDEVSLTNEKVKVTGFDNSKVGKNTLTVEYDGHTITFDVEILSKQSTNIEIKTMPLKLKYIQNYEQLDLTGGVLKVTYNDNSTDEVNLTNEKVKVTGFDNSKVGKNTLIVDYEGHTTTFDVEIVDKQVSKIEMKETPTKVNYIQNYEQLDLTGGIILISFDDKSTDEVSLTNEKVKVTGFDNSKVGKNTLTVEYEGYTTTFDVEILSKQSTKIEIKTMPVKLKYIQNYEQLDLTGGVFKVTYNDKSTDEVNLTNEKVKVTGFDNSKVGKNTLIVEYEGHTTTFDVEIVDKQVSKIEMKETPTKVNYIQNYEELDLTGGIIKVIYNDKSTTEVSLINEKIKVSGFNNSVVGKNTLTVEYEGHTTTFDVEIVDKQVSKIEISQKPTKTNYILNYEQLDLTGGIILISFDDKSTDEVSLTNEKVKVTGFDNSKVGKNTLTVEYAGYTTTFDVEIISKQSTKIVIKTMPVKLKYIQNYEQLDLMGGILEITYSDESKSEISLTNEMVKVTGFDNSKVGKKTLTVQYEGYTTTFDVEILSKQSTKIEIKTMPVKLKYIQNYEELDLTGGVIEITYNDKSKSEVSLTNEMVKVTGFDNSKVGKNTLTVEYEGHTATFDVDIVVKTIKKVELINKPLKNNYIQNYEELDLTGGIIEITYNDKSKSKVSLINDGVKVTGFDNSIIGKNTITVEYFGFSDTFEVEIISKQSIKIELITLPSRIQYTMGKENAHLNLSDGLVKVIYNDNSTDEISLTNEKVKVIGFDNSKVGKNTLTVEYEGHTVNFDIEIVEDEVIDNPKTGMLDIINVLMIFVVSIIVVSLVYIYFKKNKISFI